MSFDKSNPPPSAAAHTSHRSRHRLRNSLANLICGLALLTGTAAEANSFANSFAQLLGLQLSVEDLTPDDGQAAAYTQLSPAHARAWVQMLGQPDHEACCGLNLASTRTDPGKLFGRSEVKVSGASNSSFFVATEANGVEGEVVSSGVFLWSLELAPGTRLTATSDSTVQVRHVGTPSPDQWAWASTSLDFVDANGLDMGSGDWHIVVLDKEGVESHHGMLLAAVENTTDSVLTVTLLASTAGFVTSVPEPTPLAFFGPGLLVLWWRARRR